MTPLHIDQMIDKICGMFPTVPVPRNGMKAAWGADKFLHDVTVEQARQVMELVEKHNTVPSLPELKIMLRSIIKKDEDENPVCNICNGTGWDDGMRIENGVIVHERFTSVDMRGNVCTTVTKCECRK